ncbi:MAG: hypothetical protein A3H69_03235 [Candidatus Sungbacteria bacterium RIFCSPLOWO2_02_FULL_47_9]|uniref:Uncharacterized protein n=2 Tax=Parcubacteria group TaxID=1794811 RepID=A0A1G2RPY9_9BACT|nr:MAG: hypothetical protein UX72_C0003G0018 [Parcubacteria group bacterium GW2011_GWA2_47_10]OGZ93953.1 MAG: hypothetical protein A2633_00735 [Candidatus Sungbacteria bacterium RIFCSPHIGHO2_01_FULL_47_32]OHA10401.1 MAG: hypothetical protein A3H69_03235 [Candidatus Sungbacteria bacterium RIFCSPLOWO2_02_FULL_47_9]OHA74930.1 MAG: hypothetical protein A3A32_03730 [Candidatus Wildermuthbacteria bacterium RIFCSPLOWO2_01_FULL_48_35]
MYVGNLWGEKAILWGTHEKPTLKQIRDAAKKEFPDIPDDELDDRIVLTSGIDNDGRSLEAYVVLLRKRP